MNLRLLCSSLVACSWVVSCGPKPPEELPPATVIQLSLRPKTAVVAAGRRIQLVAEAIADNGQSFDQNELVLWTVDDPTRAEVNEVGQVFGKAAGQVTVSAAHPDGPTATIVVSVIASDVARVVLTPAKSQLAIGSEQAVNATAELTAGGSEDISSKAQWASNNVGAVSVNETGLVVCKAPGQATIAATFLGVRGTASVVCE